MKLIYVKVELLRHKIVEDKVYFTYTNVKKIYISIKNVMNVYFLCKYYKL